MQKQNIYKVCIVGRPNVGKSTLFNRIVGRRQAITEPLAGTTRDRLSVLVDKDGALFELIDTGGYELAKKDRLTAMVKKQIEAAVSDTDAVLFVCDVTAGVTSQDREILSILRKSGKAIILAVNKVDNAALEKEIDEFYNFGVENFYPVSAMHNIGISYLIEDIVKRTHPVEAPEASNPIKVAVVGRPNVGKSSFINKAIKEERVIVHEEPGTTRDAVDIYLKKGGDDFIFIDTAGMRHKRKIKEPVDAHSLLRAESSIKRSDVCIVIIDGYEGLTVDDMRVISLVEESGKGCMLMVNKWDLVSGIEMSKYEKALKKRMNCIKSMPLLFASAKTGLNVDEVFSLIKLVNRNMTANFSEGELSGILKLMQKTERLPLVRAGRMIQIRSIKQEGTAPPVFGIFVNKSAFLPDDYIESVKNILREELALIGVPIRIKVRR
ncbi:MAG: ribosome biogenesis GTPase Der [Candidatus Omnitrophota bacterium]|nr:ribosome biogenesis GTPase Der [Candidatus Omnitrophota bacterium]